MKLFDYLLLLGIALAYTAASLTPQAEPTTDSARTITQADVQQGREGIVTASSHQTATWYCSETSPCTRGYGPSDLVAAIDPTTGYEKGERVTVWHGDRSVSVLLVDHCLCRGNRIIDLTRGAFSRLADPSRGVIRVVLVPGRASPTLPATDTLPVAP